MIEDLVRRVVRGLEQAAPPEDGGPVDFRERLCRWEDDLFRQFPDGHGIVHYGEAVSLVGAVFRGAGRPTPDIDLVEGFDDPKIGGYADVHGNRILIERGCLYRFLVLHECAHLLVPRDRKHGPGFTYVLQGLYRAAMGIPEDEVRVSLKRHELPDATALPV